MFKLADRDFKIIIINISKDYLEKENTMQEFFGEKSS